MMVLWFIVDAEHATIDLSNLDITDPNEVLASDIIAAVLDLQTLLDRNLSRMHSEALVPTMFMPGANSSASEDHCIYDRQNHQHHKGRP